LSLTKVRWPSANRHRPEQHRRDQTGDEAQTQPFHCFPSLPRWPDLTGFQNLSGLTDRAFKVGYLLVILVGDDGHQFPAFFFQVVPRAGLGPGPIFFVFKDEVASQVSDLVADQSAVFKPL
jgi:hypothetical protein